MTNTMPVSLATALAKKYICTVWPENLAGNLIWRFGGLADYERTAKLNSANIVMTFVHGRGLVASDAPARSRRKHS